MKVVILAGGGQEWLGPAPARRTRNAYQSFFAALALHRYRRSETRNMSLKQYHYFASKIIVLSFIDDKKFGILSSINDKMATASFPLFM